LLVKKDVRAVGGDAVVEVVKAMGDSLAGANLDEAC